MRVALRLLSTPLREPLHTKHALALLPPILLYRRLLRAHRRHLPAEERLLGDDYVKAEWRRHQKIDNPIHIIAFLTEWQMYAQALEGNTWRDEKLDKARLDMLNDDQIGQLYELMKKARNEPDE